jgi:hypothetical protein
MRFLYIFVTLVLLFFFTTSKNVFASYDKATCSLGKCEFLIGIWYSHAETFCNDRLFMEEVDQRPLGFTIKSTGKYCSIYNEK